MRKFSLLQGKLVFTFCIVSLVWACGEKQTEAPVQPKVVSQKIAVKTESGGKKEGAAKSDTPKEAASAPEGKKVAEKKAPVTKVPEKPEASTPAAEKETGKSGEKEKPGAKDAGTEASMAKGDEPSGKMIAYIPQGKIDPFAPLFREQPIAAEPEEQEEAEPGEKTKVEKEKKRRIPRTPLEKMDVSQLKLVAIVRSERGNKALVQDASGKGYVLDKGTYIGLNSGFVTKITRDKVIIEEEVEDIYGKVSLRERELLLQKPVGDI